jgi:hypothetical protein
MKNSTKSKLRNLAHGKGLGFLHNAYRNARAPIRFRRENKRCRVENFTIHNYSMQPPEENWLYRFIKARNIPIPDGLTIAFFGVHGSRKAFSWDKSDIKIFACTENVTQDELLGDVTGYGAYSDYMLSEKTLTLSIGSTFSQEDSRYFRMPDVYWRLLPPEANAAELRAILHRWSNPPVTDRRKFASLITGYDGNGVRRGIVEALSQISPVDCAGVFMHNDDTLWNEYANDKLTYLQQYNFNICPENGNVEGLVSEKLFEAVISGCIPVYWGSAGNPEPEVFNRERIMFWENASDNSNLVQFVSELWQTPKLLGEFISLPAFKETAADYIVNMFDEFEKRLRNVLQA